MSKGKGSAKVAARVGLFESATRHFRTGTRVAGKAPGHDPRPALGKELSKTNEKRINQEIDADLDKVNPRYDKNKSAYKENCINVAYAYELRRRGVDVEAKPLMKNLRKDENGPGGIPPSVIPMAWGRTPTHGTRAEIEEAFKEAGSRGSVIIFGPKGECHVFSVENAAGKVRFVDGQPTPPTYDASHYLDMSESTFYIRLDDLPMPDNETMEFFAAPRAMRGEQ